MKTTVVFICIAIVMLSSSLINPTIRSDKELLGENTYNLRVLM